MSQKASRKSAVIEEKDKKQAEPVKDMKKKMAANAEKEKHVDKATEKPVEKTEKAKVTEKPTEKAKATEKPTEKTKATEKPAEKTEKTKTTDKSDKSMEKVDKVDKSTDKKVEKNGGVTEKVEKKAESKQVDKKEEKKEEKAEKSGKPEKEKKETKPKQNGSHNGFGEDTTNGNGGSTVSSEDEVALVIDDHHDDDMFPELTYEDSDAEFDPHAPDGPSRSYTRRSQSPQHDEEVFPELTYDDSDSEVTEPTTPVHMWEVKSARTPETPRPASDKQDKDNNTDDSKVLKLKEDAPVSTDRKLRSADSPKPESKKQESPKKQEIEGEAVKESQEKDEKENGEKDKLEVDVIVEIESEEEPRKLDTNYSKSRVKVSPYRRSMRIADQTTSSVMANYTGNNTTMEMDITETSIQSPSVSLDDSSYLGTIRSMRGRRSYKKLGELSFKHTVRSTPSTSVTEHTSRPTGTVVGRKRKPEADDTIEIGTEAGFDAIETSTSASSKRMRLLDRIAQPFRRTVISTPLPARRAAEIVGINTDLPLTAPVAAPDTFDPESLKPTISTEVSPEVEREKRCIVM